MNQIPSTLHVLRSLSILILALAPVVAMAANRLAGHPSPYLALHGQDPVDWQPWGAEVLERARREGKLILLSSGYFACHWCHVMQRESYRDPTVATKLNRDFIAVKVDRELEPVLDQRLMDFAQTVNGQGGWPLNVFLTPEGYPLSAVLYLPKDAFSDYLDRLGARWKERRETLSRAAREMGERLAKARRANESTEGQPAMAALVDGFIKSALAEADRLQGGFGEQTKFPTVPQLWALMEIHGRRPNPEIGEFLRTTLDHMAELGLRDHVGDGFFRYSTDPDWRTPHFEKMLYDNALLAWLYLRAADVLDAPHYREVGLATLRFMLRDLRGVGGAFIASLSAVDERGVEGGYYLWREEELRGLLTDDELRLARLAWGLPSTTQWEAGALPLVSATAEAVRKALGLSEAQRIAAMTKLQAKLLKARSRRGLPRDEKRLTGWNGLALLALAEGARVAPELKPAASELASFLKSLWNGKALIRAVDSRGQGLGPATLGDYASAALGLVAWAEVGRDRSAAELGVALLNSAAHEYLTEEGWLEDSADLLPGVVISRHLPDTVLPSAETLWRMAARRALAIVPNEPLRQRLNGLSSRASVAMSLEPFRYGSLLASVEPI